MADVVVVGAGLTGLLTATLLARAGVSVVVLEASDRVDRRRGLGPVEGGVQEHPHRTIRALGDRADALYSWTDRGRAVLRAEGLLDPCGVLWIGNDAAEAEALQQSASALTERQVRVEIWDAERAARHGGVGGLDAGLWLPDEGRLLPGALATLAQSLRTAGGELRLDTKALAIGDEASGLGVTTARERIPCEAVILACGAGARTLAPSLEQAVVSVREQGLTVAEASATGICRAGQGWTAWGPTGDLVAVVGCRWASPHLAVGETEPVLETRVQDKLESFAARHLASTAVVERWAWCFDQSRDQLPLVGPLPGDSRIVAAVGFGPNGVALAAAAADSIAGGLLEDRPPTPRLMSTRRLVGWR